MERENTVFQEEFNPTFLFMWKGTRVEDEPNYHCHEHLELCYIQSGTGKHRIGDTIYEVKEGDLLVINEGVYHQSLAGELKRRLRNFTWADRFKSGGAWAQPLSTTGELPCISYGGRAAA